MAHRLVAAVLVIVGLGLVVVRPLTGLIVLATALAIFLDGRNYFGHGTWRAMIAFISSLWLSLGGVITTVLGMLASPGTCDATTTSCDRPEASFLLLPGFLLLALGLTLLVWSIVEALRLRRASHRAT